MLPRVAVNDPHDYEHELEKVQAQIAELQQEICVVSSAEDVENLEQKIRRLTDHLGSLLLGQKLQQALDSEAVEEAAQELVDSVPQKMKSEGKKKSI